MLTAEGSWKGLVLAAVVVLGAGPVAAGCEYRSAAGAEQALQQADARANAPDQTSEDVQFFIYEDDAPRALVEAPRMERFESEDSTYTLLHGGEEGAAARDSAGQRPPVGIGAPDAEEHRVVARIYEATAEAGDSASGPGAAATIRADRIVYQDDERRFNAHGRVVVVTAEGKRLESEHLAWLEKERRITTPGFVKITTPVDQIQGYGLQADENLDTYNLRRVTGQVTVDEAP